MKNSPIAPNTPAPPFSLPATGGKTLNLADYKGQKLVLYFYPKDDTSGCTKQACDFTASIKNFEKLGVAVVGISKDSMAAHEKFKAQYKLAFDLASDQENNVCETYGVWAEKSMYGKKYMGIERTSFLINAQGVISHVWHKVKVPGHIEDILKVLTHA